MIPEPKGHMVHACMKKCDLLNLVSYNSSRQYTCIRVCRNEDIIMKKAAPAFVLAAGTLWGIMGIFVRKLGTYGFSSIQIASLRIIFGALIFLAITVIWKRELLKIEIRDIGLFPGMGLVSLLLFTICYFTTINMASLSVAAILLYTSPIWVMLMSLVCFKEKMTKRKVLAAAMAFGGCVLVSGVGSGTRLILRIKFKNQINPVFCCC